MSVKIVALIKALPDLSREEFLRHWQEEHPAVVWQLPGLRAYRQSPAVEHRRAWPFDGMAELWFDSLDDLRAAFDSPQAQPVHEHEKHFLSSVDWFVATEADKQKPQG
ncbi:EthD family reductase [Streptomyces sp. NPDC047061]|uniref:EthD family reductase n=1 Tax=Streptomyces sp. NPDC047061 TaxID=3154605 RepID=UPI0033F3C05D